MSKSKIEKELQELRELQQMHDIESAPAPKVGVRDSLARLRQETVAGVKPSEAFQVGENVFKKLQIY